MFQVTVLYKSLFFANVNANDILILSKTKPNGAFTQMKEALQLIYNLRFFKNRALSKFKKFNIKIERFNFLFNL